MRAGTRRRSGTEISSAPAPDSGSSFWSWVWGIKYPFWRMTDGNPRAVYACLNAGDACAPDAIKNRSVCIDGDLADILAQI